MAERAFFVTVIILTEENMAAVKEKINKKGSRPKALSLELSPFFEGEKKMDD